MTKSQRVKKELSVLLATGAIVISAMALGGTVYEANQRSMDNQRNFCGFTQPIAKLAPSEIQATSPASKEVIAQIQAIVDGAAHTSEEIGCKAIRQQPATTTTTTATVATPAPD